MEKKFTLTENSKKFITPDFISIIIYQIRALKDFGYVKKGDLGGWVEKESNLSQNGNSWIYDDAVVCTNAKVSDNATVRENAEVSGSARISENAKVYGHAKISDNAGVSLNAEVFENAEIYGNASVTRFASVYGHANIYRNALISDNAKIFDYAHVYDHACVLENATVSGFTAVYDNAIISGNAVVNDYVIVNNKARISDNAYVTGGDGKTIVCGSAKILRNSRIEKTTDYVCIGPIGSRDAFVTFSKTELGICAATGCFSGAIDLFEQEVRRVHEDTEHEINYLKAIELAKTMLS